MRTTHTHPCANAHRGCPNTIFCNGAATLEDSGSTGYINVCAYEHESWECEECEGSPRCDECGVYDHLMECHWGDCSLNPLQRDDSIEAKSLILEGVKMEKSA